MAFGAKKIFPLDTRPGVGIGVKLPFNNPGVFSSTYTTQDSIKNNLINFFLTNKGEIYLNPNFGGDLRSFIFQQITDNNLEELKEDIQSKITQYFPSVIVESLDVFQSTDIYQINIILKYSIQNTGLTDTLEIAFT
jgi:phage baseplate assembly protein W